MAKRTMFKWEYLDGRHILVGTKFAVVKYVNDYDIIEDGSYLCSTRYFGTAKSICERLHTSIAERRS